MKIASPRLLLACFLILPVTASTRAQEPAAERPSADQAMSKIASLGPGVHAIKKDKKGRIVSCVVVGQSRISTVLGKAKGLEVARKRANLNASAEFVKWLKENVTFVEDTDDQTISLLEGTEEENQDTQKESGKDVEKIGTRSTSIAQGLVRGLQVLHVKTDGQDKTFTVLKGWKADTSEGVKRVASDSKKDDPDSAEASRPKSSSKKSTTKRVEKEIADSETTSSDASDYLP